MTCSRTETRQVKHLLYMEGVSHRQDCVVYLKPKFGAWYRKYAHIFTDLGINLTGTDPDNEKHGLNQLESVSAVCTQEPWLIRKTVCVLIQSYSHSAAVSFRARLSDFFHAIIYMTMRTSVQCREKMRTTAGPEAGRGGSAASSPTQLLQGPRGPPFCITLEILASKFCLKRMPVTFTQPCQ